MKGWTVTGSGPGWESGKQPDNEMRREKVRRDIWNGDIGIVRGEREWDSGDWVLGKHRGTRE